jgi:hypothetical protein
MGHMPVSLPRALPGSEPVRVARILYASQSRIEGPVYAQMERIRASAVRHNEPLGVHTALAHQSGWFLQWKEGPHDAVGQIMARVLQDPRHHGCRIMHRSSGARLLPGVWSMSIVQCDDSAAEFEARVDQVDAVRVQGLQYAPATVWRMLSTPLRHPCADRQDTPGVFRRVMVCSAGGEESFALVQHLAWQHRQEVVRRRFAGEQSLDVGSNYTDLPDGQGAVRVIAMARNGLNLGLTRALLADYPLVVLWCSGTDSCDTVLMQRLVQACADAPTPPVLMGLGASPAAHRAMFQLAHRAGMIYLDAAPVQGPDQAWDVISSQLRMMRSAANSLWRQSDFSASA